MDVLDNAGPIVGAERRGRKTGAIEQGRFGIRLPGIAYLFRTWDRAARYNNGVAFEARVRPIPLAVVPGYGELAGFSPFGDETTIHMVEVQFDLASQSLDRFQLRTRIHNVPAVMLTKSAERQTFARFFLVDRMNVIRVVACIYRDRKTGMRQVLRCESLGFAHLGPTVHPPNIALVLIDGEANYIKRKVALAEQPAPIRDHCRKQRTVLRRVFLVRFSLVPNCARDGKRHNRR